MKPHIICHMITSLDGGLHPSRWTRSPDGNRSDWHTLYEEQHEAFGGSGWIVGRVTMAEMSKAKAHPPATWASVARPWHFASPDAGSIAVAVDPAGKLHFDGPTVGGDHVIVFLGADVPDSHLAELAADGVSYVVAEAGFDLAPMLDVLGRELGIRRLLLEGGALVNGGFFAAGLVDELSLIVAPAIDGRADAGGIIRTGAAGLSEQVELSLKSCKQIGHGALHLQYAVTSRAAGTPA
ncbi:riboflavin deaminase [Azorhizobium oxalatiphilum]|uniref:Riboflavin deaminase n=1 Tax=Azorhizobium oxalatiphilum TaxID=980631 RepID=A0A917FF26_9HYPH|nr:RibD family protein [Azorhizobium oxalatiphilum]GGF71784.1 riboflavin deaminase [Azorhizobium oxalatiphilum]